MATGISTDFSIEADAIVRLSERGEPNRDGCYPSKELVEAACDDISLTASHNEDHDAFAKINMAGYHIENPETGIAYHAMVGILLARGDVSGCAAMSTSCCGSCRRRMRGAGERGVNKRTRPSARTSTAHSCEHGKASPLKHSTLEPMGALARLCIACVAALTRRSKPPSLCRFHGAAAALSTTAGSRVTRDGILRSAQNLVKAKSPAQATSVTEKHDDR